MLRRIIFYLLVLLWTAAGFYTGFYLLWQDYIALPWQITHLRPALLAFTTLMGLVCGVLTTPWLIRGFLITTQLIEQYLNRVPIQDIIFGALGLIIGLLIADLVGSVLAYFGFLGKVLWVVLMLIFGYIGMTLAVKKREEIVVFFSNLPRIGSKEKAPRGEGKGGSLKLLDTSVIIDGRIADLCASGFIEGVLLIPQFVLDELRHIADSSDVLKRNRGRRGLDMLNVMRKNENVKVQIYENMRGLEDISEVDSKLVKLAQKLGAKIITNDYNLNKVAELHGVKVLNINELANALKPIALPGEEMTVQLVKEGKEPGQGVGYLDDGTMIVVEGGKKYIGQTIPVQVTSVLQTAAGRMIFARPRNNHTASVSNMLGNERNGHYERQEEV